MLNPQTLASTLINAFRNSTNGISSASDALDVLGKELTKYITDNIEIKASWTAFTTSSPPAKDPMTLVDCKLEGLNIVLTPSNSSNSSESFLVLKNQLINAFSVATIIIKDASFSTSPAAVGTSPGLNSLILTSSGANNQQDAFSNLTSSIITWVKTLIPTTPLAGNHGSFVGQGLVTLIS